MTQVGDCFALLIEFYHGQKNYDAAYKLIENMRSRQIVLHPYLEQVRLGTSEASACSREGGHPAQRLEHDTPLARCHRSPPLTNAPRQPLD